MQLEVNPTAWLLAAVGVTLLVWLAWRRPDRRRLAWRVGASLLAGLSLVLLLFPPTYKKALDSGTAILLTEGFEAAAVTALLDTAIAQPLLFSYKTEAPEAEPVPDLYTLRQQHPGLKTVHLLGYGLEEEELPALEGARLVPHLADLPAGITAVHWPETIRVGEAAVVSGRYRGPAKEETTLSLQAAGEARDSVRVPADSTVSFHLRFTPKQAGRFTYPLISRTGSRTDTLGWVPVQVEEPQPLRVLLLAASPLFEFKFLKNHLAALQHQVALRTALSQGINQSEWINRPQTSLDRLSPLLLQQFDLVITEPQTLQNLSPAERAHLQQAVQEEGLGVLTLAGEEGGTRSTAFFTAFRRVRVGRQEPRTTLATWSGGTSGAVTALPVYFLKEEGVRALVEAPEGRLLAAGKRAGWGTVAVTAVPQTFNWQLEGRPDLYASYWAHLLSSVAKKEVPQQFWSPVTPPPPRPHQALRLTYTDYTNRGGGAPPAATVVSLKDSAVTAISLAQNPLRAEQFSGTFWPRQAGWHLARASEAETLYFFVQDSADWGFAPLRARLEATARFVARQKNQAASAKIIEVEEPVPLIWFFGLLVLSSGFLWLEEKV